MNPIESNDYIPYPTFYPDNIKGAYDVSCCGMGTYRHSLLKLLHNKMLDGIDIDNISSNNSNYLNNPYVYGWQGLDELFAVVGPRNVCRFTELHLRLLAHTDKEYHALRWDSAKEAFSVIGHNAVVSPEDLEGDTITYIMDHEDEIEMGAYWAAFDSTLLKPERHLTLRRAAHHKLGCMLAVTDQILYDAAAAGMPIVSTYRNESETLSQNWQKRFGEGVPTIDLLVEQAISTYRQFADPADEIGRHLLDEHFNPGQYLEVK